MARSQKLTGTYFGVVVDNNDPMRIGRCKVKVFQVFDKLSNESIPWAAPWKDLSGNEFCVPEIGKFVTVIFDKGNRYNPEFIYAQNFNINLERKLKSLTIRNFETMKSILFDHSTQIYRNVAEGLKIDHEQSNITLDSYGNIQLNLRDNKSTITLGSSDAQEQFVLGTTFMNWMDVFIQKMTSKPYITAKMTPVEIAPKFNQTLLNFANLRDSFLSNKIKAAKNNLIIPQTREYINAQGDGDYAKLDPVKPQVESAFLDPLTYRKVAYSQARVIGNPANQEEAEDSDNPPPTNAGAPDSSKIGADYYPGDKSFRDKGYKNAEIPISELKSISSGSSIARYNYKYLLHPEAADNFLRLLSLAKDQGIDIPISSAYRDRRHQASLQGDSAAASIGKSPHGWGGAIDIQGLRTAVKNAKPPGDSDTSPTGNKRVRESSRIFKWLDENGPKYFWYNPWRLRDGRGQDECWHFEYWGPNVKY